MHFKKGNIVIFIGIIKSNYSTARILEKIPKYELSKRTLKLNNPEISTTAERIKLECTITKAPLKIPGRGLQCTHISVFLFAD